MIVPYTVLPNVCNFEVKLISSLLIDYDIQLATNSRIPDHSILTCTLNISEYERIRNERLDRCETSSKGMKYQSTRKYNVSAIPQGLFASERCTNCLEHVVDSILDVRNIGERINTIYETLIDALHNEMDDNMNYIDFTPSSNNKTSGSMFKTIRFPYSKLKVAVQLSPGILTEWSSIGFCVRQGDNFAPTLFSLFIDSLVLEINSRSYGVPIGNDMVSCLLYADDIVFISESAHGLQTQLETLHEWTKLNCLQVNIDKTKIMHIRKASAARCDSEFMLGNTRIDFANKYRYLGLMISEDMDYAVSVKELSTAASRALGSLTSKYLHMGNMDFATYTKIFENTVIPVMDYASGVWGSKRYDVLERLQYRAIRTWVLEKPRRYQKYKVI
ncbi:unnamed protein product [Mytilus edulis]|uniref:Reverse transcriptase domain-containing protein n=1 Tax=Mytilus edulis TaxID=6550 RepID=A0A8S3PRQ3_MYTED|nr:unnamed protein product [Mytilus edulis]